MSTPDESEAIIFEVVSLDPRGSQVSRVATEIVEIDGAHYLIGANRDKLHEIPGGLPANAQLWEGNQ